MIISLGYDVEILPNFFSVVIVDITDYLKTFEDCVKVDGKKKKPVPLVQCLTVSEIKERLNKVKKKVLYITDEDDSLLLTMLSTFNQMMPYVNEQNIPVRTDMFGYNSSSYDRLMIAAFLMYAGQTNTTKELISKLYDTSKTIIDVQNNPEQFRSNYFITTLRKYKIPYIDVDVMTMFALNKCGKGKDKEGNVVYFPKSLKQTSINLQWYELLEYELPDISEKDAHYYKNNAALRGIKVDKLSMLVDKWDRYLHPDYLQDMLHYNVNDVYIVCEIIRLYIDEVRLRYNISKSYGVNVLSSSRSDVSNVLFTKFYSEFSNLEPRMWQGKKTERTAMSFKRVIFPIIKFNTKPLQDLLEEMRKTVIYSIGKDAFSKEIKLGNLVYTIATGGLHSQDTPRELKSKLIAKTNNGLTVDVKGNVIWDNLTDDSYVYIHWDITSFYPSLMYLYKISPAHLNEGVFVRLIEWLTLTRIKAKHSIDEIIDGIPKEIFAEALKIVINSIYGKLGYLYGDLFDKLAVLKVTINGQLMIMMQCENLEMNGIEVVSANTDGIVVKLYKKDKAKFDEIAKEWQDYTRLNADSEELKVYINRDINNYLSQEFNGKISTKGALNPLMYAADLSKGYDMPIVAKAVYDYFLEEKPVLNTLYECTNILDFCKTQNVGRQFHVQFVDKTHVEELQRYVRFYVSNIGGSIYKVHNTTKQKNNLAARQKVIVINSLDDISIEMRNINYKYYYEEAMKIINPIKLGIPPNLKADRTKGTKSGKSLIKTYGGMFNTLFDDLEE